jgi:hypothetical protein
MNEARNPCRSLAREFVPPSWRREVAPPSGRQDRNPFRPLRSVAATALLLVGAELYAAPPITAKVTYAGVYGNGDVYVGLDTTINEPGCPLARFDLTATSPVAKQVLAIAQLAIATGKSVVVSTAGCISSLPTLDANRNSYFYLLP